MNYSDALRRVILKKDIPYYGLKFLFDDLAKSYETHFHYVSASHKIIYHAGKWLRRYGIKHHSYLQRKLFHDKFKYKFVEIERIITQNYTNGDLVLLFGDNNELDHRVFSKLINEYSDTMNIFSFVRDVKGIHSTPLTNNKVKDGNYYFLTVLDVFKHPLFKKMESSYAKIKNLYSYYLLPDYLRKHIKLYLSKEICPKILQEGNYKCSRKVESQLSAFFASYFKNRLK